MWRAVFMIIVAAGSVMGAATLVVGQAGQTEKVESTGASLAWTSADPLIAQSRQLLLAGELSQAETLLRSESTTAAEEMREIIRRLRREYSVDEPGLLEKLRKSIPGISAEDLRRWTAAGEVQHRIIDGKVMYFRREPSNIFRFCDEAKSRRQPPDADTSDWKLVDHLARVIAEAESSGKVEVLPVRHRIFYTLTVPANAPGARKGSILRAWLPYPKEYRQQKDIKLSESSPSPTKIASNDAPHRSLYYEIAIEDPAKPVEIKAVFDYVSYAYYPILKEELAKPLPASWGDQDLTSRPPHIDMTDDLKRMVKQIIGEETNPLARVRKIFHWIDANVRYCAEEEYCLIPSISTKALKSLKGDCGVQGLLFITMCRAAGVPARWQSGWETKPVNWNMHDWAEFYVEPWGWLPADPSYGLQKSEDPKVREFYIGHQDSYRLIVNSDYGRALVPAKTSLRSEPADFQRGEVELDGRNLYFDEWDYDFRFEQDPQQR